MKGSKLPLSMQWVSGAIGKKYVVKRYDYGIVQTKFPDMSNIKPTGAQSQCRNYFKEAVSLAKPICSDPKAKDEWMKKLKVKRRLFNALVSYFMQQLKQPPVKNDAIPIN